MRHEFIPGTIWILSENASCIPSGCYRLQNVEEEFLVFAVGPDISFGLTKDFYAPILKKARTGQATRTSPSSFLRRYAKLIQAAPAAPVPLSGMTFCAMAPHLQRKLMGMCPLAPFSSGATMH
jgi:hypothetical protein